MLSICQDNSFTKMFIFQLKIIPLVLLLFLMPAKNDHAFFVWISFGEQHISKFNHVLNNQPNTAPVL